jgi:2-dehydro-3-deoxyphosphogluconate aldolase/(4S)-4-hydroxy-2-oxoglutarate aldolase
VDISAIAALAPVIPALTTERVADAVPLARALVKGGLPVLEITLRTATAMAALEAIARAIGILMPSSTIKCLCSG